MSTTRISQREAASIDYRFSGTQFAQDDQGKIEIYNVKDELSLKEKQYQINKLRKACKSKK